MRHRAQLCQDGSSNTFTPRAWSLFAGDAHIEGQQAATCVHMVSKQEREEPSESNGMQDSKTAKKKNVN